MRLPDKLFVGGELGGDEEENGIYCEIAVALWGASSAEGEKMISSAERRSSIAVLRTVSAANICLGLAARLMR